MSCQQSQLYRRRYLRLLYRCIQAKHMEGQKSSDLSLQCFGGMGSLHYSEAPNQRSILRMYMHMCQSHQLWSWFALMLRNSGVTEYAHYMRTSQPQVYSENQCPVSGCSHSVAKDSVVAHFLTYHTTLNIMPSRTAPMIFFVQESLNQTCKDI